MSFDNSRFTFNPWNDYLGVVMQQGRVQLDSDWNEWLAEFARRIQAGTLDTLGRSGVPSSTPSAFQISPSQDASGTQHVMIGVGRIYVDGLLAENHGSAGLVQWNPALAEWAGASQTPVDYTSQPYLPGATLPVGNGPFLVYLDVWQRDVSYLEDTNLVDKAVGIDTTGRRQTVWQVKLLDVSKVAGGVTCATPDSAIAPWESVILPSPSLLTNGVVPSASAGPCSLSPVTGFTGLENQLYRVEIHQGGIAVSGATIPVTKPVAAGTATFKWSRENASVATAVTGISSVTNSKGSAASQLTVQSMGRDQVLGFNPGDWIEILDDFRELNPPQSEGQAQAGELHQIDSINSAAKTITLNSVVSAAFPVNSTGQTDPRRHTRIERWDQSGTVYESDGATVWVDLDADGTTGDIPVPPPGTTLILENGITVAFDLGSSGNWNATTTYTPGEVVASGGNYYISIAANNQNQAPPNPAFWAVASFQTGDFWSFAARTADGSVEPLTEAPPRGIYHHYSRLGIVDFAATPPTVVDCRRLFPALANPCIQVMSVVLGSGAQLLNDGTVSVQALASGINVVCDAPVDPAIITQSQPAAQTQSAYAWNSAIAYTPGQVVTNGGVYYICTEPNTNQAPPNPASWAVAQFNCPICFVTVDLPAPTTPPGGGFNPLTLSSTVSVASTAINWLPTAAASAALVSQVSQGGPPLLAHLTLKGGSIWAQEDPLVFLNGAGDGRTSSDFKMWFWLISQPVVTLSPPGGALPFANQVVGTSSAALPVTLTNNGATAIDITSPIAVSGEDPADFSLSNLCGTSLAAGASCTINVTFTPQAAGARSGQINITESADSNPLVITLTGTGIAPQVNASPTSLSFSPQIVGTTSAPQIVTLTNPGTAPLTISAVTLSTADFSQTSSCIPPGGSGTLQPGQQCQINVQFTPTTTGARSDQLSITHNAPGSPLVVPLAGTGTVRIKFKDSIDIPKGTRDIVKTSDVKTVEVKTFDVKTFDVKTSDKTVEVKTRELKVREGIMSEKESPAEGVAEAGSEEATRKAFISPEERPPVDPQTSGNPDDEPPKE